MKELVEAVGVHDWTEREFKEWYCEVVVARLILKEEEDDAGWFG